ncbi:membrane protein [Arthrobacter phage Atuin]|nr:membrane protein [Arthrobacter phage Atuin]
MTRAKFSNCFALYVGLMVVFTSAIIVSVTVFHVNPWIVGAVQAFVLMFSGSKMASWLYTETTIEAFRKLAAEQERGRMLPRTGQETEGEV